MHPKEAMRDLTFMVFGLPRSRTAWFSTMLSLGDRVCHHEAEVGCEDFESFRRKVFADGNSSTLAWKILPQILEAFPNLRYCWLGRNPRKIAQSCRASGHPEFTETLAEEMWSEAHSLGAVTDKFFEVENLNLDLCRNVWNHLIPDQVFPQVKVENLLRMNVQLTKPEFTQVTSKPIPWMMEAIA